MKTKRCTKCLKDKSLLAFHKDSRCKKDGRQPRCKQCKAIYNKNNKERISKANKDYRKANSDVLKEKSRQYYQKNRDSILAKQRNAPEHVKERKRKYVSEYQKRNREARSKYSKEYVYKRRRTDPNYRAVKACRTLLWNTLSRTGQGRASCAALGYSKQQLIDTITARFLPGMSWDNHGQWHIDHKIPVAHFMRKGELRPSIINALCNLQPMWAQDNWTKGDSYPYIQP